MKNLGRVNEPKDITTKEYVDTNVEQLEVKKLNSEDLQEFTNLEILALWNKVMAD